MTAVLASAFPGAPEYVIDDRRRLGIDKLDELSAGEWHLVNPPQMWRACGSSGTAARPRSSELSRRLVVTR
jgi:hypothetical protein